MKTLIATLTACLITLSATANTCQNAPDCVNYPAPTNLQVSYLIAAGNQQGFHAGQPYVHLWWSVNLDNSASQIGYDIERSTDGVNFKQVAMGYWKGHWNYYFDTVPGETYYYRVRLSACSLGASGTMHVCFSNYSNIAWVTIPLQ